MRTLQNRSYDEEADVPHGRSRILVAPSDVARASNAATPVDVASSTDCVIFTSSSSTARNMMVTVKGSCAGVSCSGTL